MLYKVKLNYFSTQNRNGVAPHGGIAKCHEQQRDDHPNKYTSEIYNVPFHIFVLLRIWYTNDVLRTQRPFKAQAASESNSENQ